ncbi:uncharacterized protein LOC108628429 [Ceratina calcarata]|uniref:Uncharacterized protein LOC108628429 n=1 Tax=Ceratina calcarata TaxID=156304 RepID=A0AAJ7S6P9_9HYME|nr:uncharacterized protein LOC108628429 [Ceratina calcarata]XP_026672355.1 uncharacterized protein LOC108628429 [Ceratina calcarata]XP_026672356.1 uncharacterized protein LOC108628429 [Ceratina calcarata]
MKGIIAVFLLISVANADPFWGGWPPLSSAWNRRFVPQPPKRVHDHNHGFGEPDYTQSQRCQLLENLFSMKQDCTLASICRNPGTSDIIISELTESQLMTLIDLKQDRFRNEMSNNNPNPCNGMSDKTDFDNMKNNNEKDNSNNDGKVVATSPIPVTTYEPVITTSPHYHGGEGIIDIRIGDDD